MPGKHRNTVRPIWTESMRKRAEEITALRHAIARGDREMITDAQQFDVAESTTCVDCGAVVFPTMNESGAIRCSVHRAQAVLDAIALRQRLAAD